MNPESLHERIGAFIATRRRQLKMKQEGLAKRAGISRASLANIERGRQSVLVHVLYSIAKALEIPPSQLLPDPRQLVADEAVSVPADLKKALPSDLSIAEAAQVSRLILRMAPINPSKEGRRASKKR